MDLADRLNRLSPEQRAQLALRLSETSRQKDARKTVQLPEIHPDRANRHEQFSLSDIQQAYLIGRSEGVELGNISCHSYFEVDFEDWEGPRFETALQKLIERHEMLRCIVFPDGRQQILEHVPPYRVECLDLRGQTPESAARQLDAVREKLSHKVHQTDSWPLFRFLRNSSRRTSHAAARRPGFAGRGRPQL